MGVVSSPLRLYVSGAKDVFTGRKDIVMVVVVVTRGLIVSGMMCRYDEGGWEDPRTRLRDEGI